MAGIAEHDIAIIGMSGRFPKAGNLTEYWENLVNGVNSIEKADPETILASGTSADILNHSRFVHAASNVNEAKYFDADFFGLSNTEALLMDPQIRMMLQTSWHAMEDAGYDTSRTDVSVGNFCGMTANHYLLSVLNSNAADEQVDPLLYRIMNDKDFLATWISYKLNLTGPAMSVQTACSTSLLAVHLACQSLLNGECDMALAGGVCYSADNKIGYVHVPESIYSKDGVCRPFDKDASGTVGGNGVGAVVLKRAADAVRDKDHMYALIKGTAVNNDGSNKQGYTTPSVNLQRDVILEALAVADIDPETIGMIEAHGTGTIVGDPIEVTALTEAYRQYTPKEQYCAIGSVKGNIGHLDAAAGIASVIKATLCVYHNALVPNINFSAPNPLLELPSSPFYVSQTYTPWPGSFAIRRAGVSSLGVGGTNVHVIIEQPPQLVERIPHQQPSIVTLSAMSEKNLYLQQQQLAAHIRAFPDTDLADIEFTTVYGRKVMPFRFSALCRDNQELVAQLLGEQTEQCFAENGPSGQGVFLFPGQGSQYPGMITALYETNQAFRSDVDYCFNYLNTISGIDFRQILFGDDGSLMDRTENTQVVLFITEYCLAKEMTRTGVKPVAMIGHSLGEYVAACLADCIALDDALKLIFHRGKLMGAMPGGAMLLVRATREDLTPLLLKTVSLCAVNTLESIVIGGAAAEIEQQIVRLTRENIQFIKLKVSHAYHTPMMADVLEAYGKVLAEVHFKPFTAKIFSTYTGGLVTSEQFCSPAYWLNQIIHPVKFFDAVLQAAQQVSNPVFIEVGPGNGLSSFVKAILQQQAATVQLLPKTPPAGNPLDNFYRAKAALVVKGLVVALPETHPGRRISLPGYVFSKTYFWKPRLQIQYKDVEEIKASYHHANERYRGEQLRVALEIPLAGGHEVSDGLLTRFNELHAQYIADVQQLFAQADQKIHSRVEVLYEDTLMAAEDDGTPDVKSAGKSRNSSGVFEAPSTDTEKRIAAYWSGVLGYQPTGIQDNYFEVGGNSLLATKLMAQLSDEFEMKLAFKELSECLTIKELAAFIDSRKRLMTLAAHAALAGNNNDNYIEI